MGKAAIYSDMLSHLVALMVTGGLRLAMEHECCFIIHILLGLSPNGVLMTNSQVTGDTLVIIGAIKVGLSFKRERCR